MSSLGTHHLVVMMQWMPIQARPVSLALLIPRNRYILSSLFSLMLKVRPNMCSATRSEALHQSHLKMDLQASSSLLSKKTWAPRATRRTIGHRPSSKFRTGTLQTVHLQQVKLKAHHPAKLANFLAIKEDSRRQLYQKASKRVLFSTQRLLRNTSSFSHLVLKVQSFSKRHSTLWTIRQ